MRIASPLHHHHATTHLSYILSSLAGRNSVIATTCRKLPHLQREIWQELYLFEVGEGYKTILLASVILSSFPFFSPFISTKARKIPSFFPFE